MTDKTVDLLAKIGISIVAIAAFIVPEPASSLTGVTILGAVWGYDLLGDQEEGDN